MSVGLGVVMPAWTGLHASGYAPCGVVGPSGEPCVLFSDHYGAVHVDVDGREWLDASSPRRTEETVWLPGDAPE